ncbi:HAD-IIA family hydrolase [Marinobacterium rhizophilum]|uniref:HAD family hydrolase n=1 Tax=Marinobacterium rhizophilum TaxID=420402 RepID=A0ABY5HJH4_9GAMM|nr:HAD-IIA family hydrolase [Marinobacterium rhizophilum]UTW11962.1 HAD family hydrolase [Marinobacterium rhizophilum]
MTEEKSLPQFFYIKSRDVPCHLLDMDGVLVRGSKAVQGSAEYLKLLVKHEVPFLVFSNNSRFTPEVMAINLSELGFPITPENVYTSAMTTAHFIHMQKPGASYFPIGDEGLICAMEKKGCIFDDVAPDYVVVGESLEYSYKKLAKGANLVNKGARFIGTNPDLNIPAEDGDVPACGAACALIKAATGITPYFLGKPNPFMMRAALEKLGVHAANAVMVGDRMDTDVIAGMELGLKTVLVLTGASQRESINGYPYSPDLILPRLLDLKEHMGLG